MVAKLFVPAMPPTTVVRRRLLDRVSDAVKGPLTFVGAPAGSGKSVLLASWCAAGMRPGPLVWITLGPGDDRPGTFWSYVLAGLDRIGRPVPAAQVPSRAESVDDSFLIRLAAHLYGQAEPIVLVLDEADVLGAPGGVPAGLDFVLRHARPQLRLVLASRVEPALPLHRYRLAGSMTEIRLDELAFTTPEAAELLAAHGVTLSEPSLATLVSRTRGWPASLRLAALTLQHTPSVQVERVATGLAGDRGALADYFLSEVLRSQPENVQAFLLRTSVADHLTSGLAQVLSGRPDAARMLEALAHANALIDACDEHEDCYRCHPLFAEMLRAQLARESPGHVAPLHHAAARWLAQAGSLAEAVRHFSAAGDWSAAAALVVRRLAVAPLLTGTDHGGLADVLAGAPGEPATAELAVLLAILAARQLDRDRCLRHLTRAAELLPGVAADDLPAVTLAGSLAVAVSGRLAGESIEALRAAASAEAAVGTLIRSGRPVPPEARSVVAYEKGLGLFWAGQLGAAAAALTSAAQVAHQSGLEAQRMQALGQLALAEALRGRLTRADELGRETEAIAESLAMPADRRSAAATAALAWVRSEKCDSAAARAFCDRAAERVTIVGDALTVAVLALMRTRLLRARGNVDGALALVEQARLGPAAARTPTWLEIRLRAEWAAYEVTRGRVEEALDLLAATGRPDLPYVALALASAEIARGRLEAARSSLSPVFDQGAVPLDVGMTAWLLRASVELGSGRPVAARACLERALRLAAPEQLRRPLLDAAPELRGFLRRNRELAAEHPWLQALGPRLQPAAPRAIGAGVSNGSGGVARPSEPAAAPRAAAATGGAAPPVLLLPLTEKETEVLGHLSALLSTEEIARTMFVSVNTVKTHVRAILRKLEVSGRNEAIRRARDLQLI